MECNSEISTILSIHVIDQSIVSSPELAVSTCIGFFPNTTLFFFISLSYFMVFQFRSSIIDTRYFVSLYFSLQRVREEYCVYIYSFCKVKGKCRIKKKKRNERDKLYRYVINFSKYNGEEDSRMTRNTSNTRRMVDEWIGNTTENYHAEFLANIRGECKVHSRTNHAIEMADNSSRPLRGTT